jgi:fructosamine-3-kinase
MNKLNGILSDWLGEERLLQIDSVAGGDVNDAYKLETTRGQFFVKLQRYTISDLFEKEAQGLKELAQSSFKIPTVEFVSSMALVLEWLEKDFSNREYWTKVGEQLANLHRVTQTQFGLEVNNYIATLQQFNDFNESWDSFFMQNRIEVQLKLAIDKGEIDSNFGRYVDKLYPKLDAIFPKEKPALLHGDLWSGNIMNTVEYGAALFDSAVYYGHREMDLAMTKLFGGFNDEFYGAYYNNFPVEPGFEDRLDVYNLYPLLVHVNLFGGSYVMQVQNILDRYV